MSAQPIVPPPGPPPPPSQHTVPDWAEQLPPDHLFRFRVERNGQVLELMEFMGRGLRKDLCWVLGKQGPTLVDFPVRHPSISREHCVLIFGRGALWIMDKSTHGTYLNGVRISFKSWERLTAGDKVKLGMSTRTYILEARLPKSQPGPGQCQGTKRELANPVGAPAPKKPAGVLGMFAKSTLSVDNDPNTCRKGGGQAGGMKRKLDMPAHAPAAKKPTGFLGMFAKSTLAVDNDPNAFARQRRPAESPTTIPQPKASIGVNFGEVRGKKSKIRQNFEKRLAQEKVSEFSMFKGQVRENEVEANFRLAHARKLNTRR